MAEKKIYIGSHGPSLYEDDDLISDADGEFDGQYFGGLVTDGNILAGAFALLDTDQSNHLTLTWNEDDTADRTFQFLVGGGNRSLTLNENFTIGDGSAGILTYSSICTLTIELASVLNQDLTTDASPTFAGIVIADGGTIGQATGPLLTFDDTNNNLTISGGAILFSGTSRVTRHLDINLADLTGPAATLPALSIEGIFITYDFSKTSEQSLYYKMNIPYRWALTTDMEVHFFWLVDANAADAAKFVRWGFEYKAIKAGEVVVGAGTKVTQDVASLDVGNHTAGTLIETTFTTKLLGAALAVHDQMSIRFYRDATNDDYNADARLVAVHVEYMQDKLGQPT